MDGRFSCLVQYAVKEGGMALKVTVTNSDFPEDYEFEVRGLGLFTNGKSRSVTEDEEAAYIGLNGVSVRDGTKGSENIKVEGTAEVKAPEPVEEEEAPTEDKGGES
jgi:hypothetical protein